MYCFKNYASKVHVQFYTHTVIVAIQHQAQTHCRNWQVDIGPSHLDSVLLVITFSLLFINNYSQLSTTIQNFNNIHSIFTRTYKYRCTHTSIWTFQQIKITEAEHPEIQKHTKVQ